jgi:curli production assembly/transport component CsgG
MKKHFSLHIIALCLMSLALAGCSASALTKTFLAQEPEINTSTNSANLLRNLPVARVKPVVAVYDFTDQTGQHRPNDKIAEFSRAVTQGGASILSEALSKAASGKWFTVIERNGLDHLLRERQIIAATREQYGMNSKLPPMLYAGVLLEGGIVSYESNTLTGGLGAKYLGVGGATEYRQDIVTVYLRAVNVQNGEVLLSVDSAKTIYSSSLTGGAYRFVALNRLLEIESGITMNEPPQLAVRQAIEASVYSLIVEGAIKGIWEFADEVAGKRTIEDYLERVYDIEPAEEVEDPALPLKESAEEVAAPPAALSPAPTPVVSPEKEAVAVPELAPVVQETVTKPLTQAPTLNQPVKNVEKRVKALRKRGDINASRYNDRFTQPDDAVTDPNTQMYCTQSGCYPFPD